MDHDSLKNQIAVITGAGSGIGRIIAKAFTRKGAQVAVVDVDLESAQEAVRIIRQSGGEAISVRADVSDPEAVEGLFEQVEAQLGAASILVNNAGVTHPAVSILELDPAHLDRVFAVDYKGVYLCSRRAGKAMAASGGGCIVNISSIAGLTPLPLVAYGPMKSAVNMLTRILAREWAHCGVRVNAVAPGYVLTPLIEKMIDSGQRNPDRIVARIPMGRMLDPKDIADAAAFLASENARHITGAVLPVDGGWTSDGGWSAYDR